jgi:hypothetical protein
VFPNKIHFRRALFYNTYDVIKELWLLSSIAAVSSNGAFFYGGGGQISAENLPLKLPWLD